MTKTGFLILLLGMFLAGCNTVQGFGRDLEKLGDKIDDKATEKKHY